MDRNDRIMNVLSGLKPRSLSARRAWIEIVYPGTWTGSILSLSARRAWIEIIVGVLATLVTAGRSPQGERG